MSSWEYLVVEFSKIEKKGMGFSISSQGGYYPRWVNGQQMKDWENQPAFRSYIAKLGQEGWELSGNGPAEHGGFNCVFRRLI
jgi:hypothetical protein